MHEAQEMTDAGVAARRTAVPLPEVVVLPPSPHRAASAAPPVRIFLGTEDAQHRAERVFIWSIEKVRDQTRRYEIHLMKNLPGFRTAGWRTGFTNYRFAIPDFAGRGGRAIYNDVDQIYLADPAQLFDTPLDGHGFLSISPQETSVMLLDCAVMSAWWNFAAASTRSKEELLAAVRPVAGLWGQLDAEWNARDLEYRRGESRLFHFTALHTQPWQPTPDQYSYHPNVHGDLWFELEREADATGFEVFTREHPSRAFIDNARNGDGPNRGQEPGIRSRGARSANTGPRPLAPDPCSTVRATGGATASPSQRLMNVGYETTPPAGEALDIARDPWPDSVFDEVRMTEGLERVPTGDVPWVLAELFAHARRAVRLRVASANANDETRWLELIHRAAARHPNVAWSLERTGGSGKRARFEARPPVDPPRIWVLLGVKAGDNAQLRNLARALGWPCEEKQLAFNALRRLPNVLLGASRFNLTAECARSLTPPWPDLILSAGKRSAPVARWIARQSGGNCRIVHLGRPRQPLSCFDLVITTPQYGLPARPNVVHNLLPLNCPSRERLAEAAAAWASRFESLSRPRIAVLVGGSSKPYIFDERSAARLADQVNAMARETGGSLLVTSSPRTPREPFDAFCARLAAPAHVHRWSATGDNPYLAYLAIADSFVVTADSASLLAEACSTGKPVALFTGSDDDSLSTASGRARRLTERGTPHQQKAPARLRDWLVVNGWLVPDRDLRELHQVLALRGAMGQAPDAAVDPAAELERTADRVRRMLISARRVPR